MAKAVETGVKWKILRRLVVERRRLTKKNEHMATHVQRGVDHLSMFAGAPGVLELLSWTEGAFDVHIVFPLYEEGVHTYLQREQFSGLGGSNELLRLWQHILTGLRPAWLVPEVMTKPTKSIGKSSSSSRKRKAPSSNDKNTTVRLPFLKRCCNICWLSYHKSFSRQHKTSAFHWANKQRWLRGLRPFRYFPIHHPYWPTSAHTIASHLQEVADLLPPIDRRR